ncbi:MAG: exodeoxyribonuclease V subunit beta [Pseudomonadota bacterium]
MTRATEPQPLALRFPLHGSRLIEASAGTGKTYTIAALYVRLVLGHDPDDTAFSRALLPSEILVVTFTEAATQELRDRIRRRLVESARAFRGELSDEPDAFLQGLLDDYPAERHAALARQLDLAAQSMDDAAIATIHGWCQRMLREHAFDSGSLFTEVLEPDLSALLTEAVRDYWRAEAYPLLQDALALIESAWQSPDAMLPTLRQLFASSDVLPAGSLQDALKQALAQWQALKAPWLARADHIEAVLSAAIDAGLFSGQKLSLKYLTSRLKTLRDWAASPTAATFDKPENLAKLSLPYLHEALKAKTLMPDSLSQDTVLQALADLPEQVSALPKPVDAAWHHAAQSVSQRFTAAKQARALLGFDDLLTRLDAALQGERGDTLRALIRQQFPVALIDEFQDTDPLQYRLFDALYELAANHRERGIFLIGDPKQAIYSFRGADINAYLKARQDTAGRLSALDTNFRSSQTLVTSVNALFEQAEAREDASSFAGAFGYKHAAENPMPFVPVQANDLSRQWTVLDATAPALTLWTLPSETLLSKTAYIKEMAARCASEMVRLLSFGQQGRAGFRAADGKLIAVTSADMAVLVRDFSEASAIRTALAARGVRSVYLSDRDSLYDSLEAPDVLRLLMACAAPENETLIRTALASASLAQPLTTLDALQRDDRAREAACLRFADYQRCWRERGVLPLLRRVLFDYDLPARWQATVDGERRLTNWLHLADLLQQASRELDGEQALIRWLREHIDNEHRSEGEDTLRLESDEGLVKVITIHKSKGLEYPLVFLPFICGFKDAASTRKAVMFWHDGERRRAELNPDARMRDEAEAQRLREDMRLLYVALTRAQHACWLGLAHLGFGKASHLQESAIGALLWGVTPLAEPASWAEQLASMPPGTQILPAPDAIDTVFSAHTPDVQTLAVRPLARRPEQPWWIASYSAIRYQPHAAPSHSVQAGAAPSQNTQPLAAAQPRHDDAAPQSAREQQQLDDEPLSTALLLADMAEIADMPDGDHAIQQFPRGARWGDFLHGLFEVAAEQGFASVVRNPSALNVVIEQRCTSAGIAEQTPVVQDWILRCLTHPLPLPDGTQTALADAEDWKAELEFLLPAHSVEITALDALAQAETLPGHAKVAAQPGLLNGLFKGFIDLVFVHDGRYFVLDYKSNALGSTAGDYSHEAIAEAMAGHRYDLQYLCYVLALHRQLRVRLPDYDYDRDIGGVVYFFLRGLDGPARGVFSSKPSRQVIEAMDQLFQGGRP